MTDVTLDVLAERLNAFCTRNDEAHNLILGRLDRANDGAEHRQRQINDLMLDRARRDGEAAAFKRVVAVAITATTALTSALTFVLEKFL